MVGHVASVRLYNVPNLHGTAASSVMISESLSCLTTSAEDADSFSINVGRYIHYREMPSTGESDCFVHRNSSGAQDD